MTKSSLMFFSTILFSLTVLAALVLSATAQPTGTGHALLVLGVMGMGIILIIGLGFSFLLKQMEEERN